MPLHTISLNVQEDAAAIKILSGIHRNKPITSFKSAYDGYEYQVFVLSEECPMDVLFEYERAKNRAERNGVVTDRHIIWYYVKALAGDFQQEDFAEEYENVTS